jgi:hypothetical protein
MRQAEQASRAFSHWSGSGRPMRRTLLTGNPAPPDRVLLYSFSPDRAAQQARTPRQAGAAGFTQVAGTSASPRRPVTASAAHGQLFLRISRGSRPLGRHSTGTLDCRCGHDVHRPLILVKHCMGDGWPQDLEAIQLARNRDISIDNLFSGRQNLAWARPLHPWLFCWQSRTAAWRYTLGCSPLPANNSHNSGAKRLRLGGWQVNTRHGTSLFRLFEPENYLCGETGPQASN